MDRSADWMAQAVSDLDHARYSLQGRYYDWACFSAQQAAEKATKAVLQRLGLDACGHSVADLLDAIAASHAVADELPTRLLSLTRHIFQPALRTRFHQAHQGRGTDGPRPKG